MPSSTPMISSESLLQHEPFVTAVVRGLLSDEARVQDVLQETWLTALRRPPRAAVSLRAWLARVAGNLARDSRRSESRRRVRERVASRTEGVESVDVTFERLSAQREVVDAVLALEEPYRTVVLLRYYQDLSPMRIAERLGRSAATVRSQLTRAREILRAVLDRRFAGGRRTWSGLLLLPAPATTLSQTIGRMWRTTTAKVACVGIAVLAVPAIPLLLNWSVSGQRAPAAEVPGPLVPAEVPSPEPALTVAGVGVERRQPIEIDPPLEVDRATDQEEKIKPTIRGRVVDIEGQHITGASLDNLWTFADPGASENVDLSPRLSGDPLAVTGEDGRFERVVDPGHLPERFLLLDAARERGATFVAERPGEVGDIILRPLVEVRAEIAFTSPGELPDQAALWLVPDSGPGVALMGFSHSGRHALRVPPGRYRVSTSNDRQGLFGSQPTDRTVKVESEAVDLGRIEVSIPELAELRFVLRDEEGKATGGKVAGSWILDHGHPSGSRGSKATDEPGTVVLTQEIYSADQALTFLALDVGQKLGGLAVVPPAARSRPIEVTMEPIVRITGRFAYSTDGEIPEYTIICAYTPDGDHRVMRCINREGRIDLWLPPGEWLLRGYGTHTKTKKWTVSLGRDERERDLGLVKLEPTAAYGLVGEQAPPWTVKAARGLGDNAQPSDFRGRYLLLEFWGHW